MCLWVFILMTISALALDSRLFRMCNEPFFDPLELNQFSFLILSCDQRVTSESSDSYFFYFHSICAFSKTSSQRWSKQTRSSRSVELVSFKPLPGNTGQCINELENGPSSNRRKACISRRFC